MPDSPRRTLKRKLLGQELTLGIRADFPCADMAEFIGTLGYDFIFLDCENAGPDFQTVVQMARAARCGGSATLLRPWSLEPGLCSRFLDCGVDGIIAPDLQSARQAETLLETIVAAAPNDAENVAFIPVIESKAGVDDLDEILRIRGVDGVFVGPADLAVSLGEPRRGEAPRTRESAFRVIERARAMGKSAGLPAGRYGAEAARKGGANLLLLSSCKEALRSGAQQQLQPLQAWRVG